MILPGDDFRFSCGSFSRSSAPRISCTFQFPTTGRVSADPPRHADLTELTNAFIHWLLSSSSSRFVQNYQGQFVTSHLPFVRDCSTSLPPQCRLFAAFYRLPSIHPSCHRNLS